MLFRSKMGSYIVERVKVDNGGTLKGKKVQVIGVAYKADVADVRETPAEQIIEALEKAEAEISWHDPLVGTWHGKKATDLGSDIAIVVTLHSSFNEAEIMKSAHYVLDTSGKLAKATQL